MSIEQQQGKVIKIKGFPAEHKVKLFRVVLSTQRTDYIVTNEMAQNNMKVVQDVCGFHWKVEQFHRETKQLTGLEGNQCRKARIFRNQIFFILSPSLKKCAYVFRKSLNTLNAENLYGESLDFISLKIDIIAPDLPNLPSIS